MTTTVICVKRKRLEDARTALRISCKRARLDSEDVDQLSSVVTFKYGATTEPSDSAVSVALKRLRPGDGDANVAHLSSVDKIVGPSKRARTTADGVVVGGGDESGERTPLADLNDVVDEIAEQSAVKQSADAAASPHVATTSAIFCNGLPMVSMKSEPDAPLDDIVYDLYVASNGALEGDWMTHVTDIRFDNEVAAREIAPAEESDSECDESEDSNAEDNWRNDYPDEDSENEERTGNSSDSGDEDDVVRRINRLRFSEESDDCQDSS